MNTEQREEIEKACKDLEFYDGQEFLPRCCEEDVRMLVKFARQQLNLRVDGAMLIQKIKENGLTVGQCDGDNQWVTWRMNAPEKLEALVLECLTTTPEEKDHV